MYTAQKQILLSPKNTKMLLGRGKLLIFIGCILLVFKFWIVTKQRTYSMWMGRPLSLLAPETACYHPSMERAIWPGWEVLGLGAREWGLGSGILVRTGLSEPGWVKPVLSTQCWCRSLLSRCRIDLDVRPLFLAEVLDNQLFQQTVTELVSALIICSTVSTQPVSFPMDLVRHSSNAPGVASHFCSSFLIASLTLASSLSFSVWILTKSLH